MLSSRYTHDSTPLVTHQLCLACRYVDDEGRYWNEFARPGKELRTRIVIKRGIHRELEASARVLLPETAMSAKNYLVTDSVVDAIYGEIVLAGFKAAGVACQKIVIPADAIDDAGESSTEPYKVCLP